MSTGSYNEKRSRGQRHFGGWFGTIVVVGVLFAFSGQSVNAQTTSPPAPPAVTVKIIKATGTGCQQGTLSEPKISESERTLTLAYSDYTAEDGVGIPASEMQKTCEILLDIVYPRHRLRISAVRFKGFADLLDTNTVGQLSARYFFQGQPQQVDFIGKVSAPIFDNYDTSVLTPSVITPTSGPVMFGPCGGGTLNINTYVLVQGTGILTAETTTGLFQQIYTLDLQPC